MLLEPLSVPVKLSPTASDIISHDIIDIDGLLAYRDGNLMLEYRTLSMSMGKSPVQTVRLGLQDVREIVMKKQFFRWTIILRPREMSMLEGVPGAENHSLGLKVDRKYHEEAERLVSLVGLELSEMRLNELAPELSGIPSPVALPDNTRVAARGNHILPGATREGTDERRAVAAALRRINDAWLAGRPADMAPLLHERMVMAYPGFSGRSEGRDEMIAGFADFTSNARVAMYRESDNQIDVAGDTAVATFAFEMIYERDGGRYLSVGRDMWVFTREESDWRAVWRTMTDLREEDVTGNT